MMAPKTCDKCLGKGFYLDLDGDGYGSEVVCPDCSGEGKTYDPDDPDHERDIKED